MWSMEAPGGRSTSALEERTALLTAPTSPGVRAGAWLCTVPSLSEGGTLCPEGGMQGKEAGGIDFHRLCGDQGALGNPPQTSGPEERH